MLYTIIMSYTWYYSTFMTLFPKSLLFQLVKIICIKAHHKLITQFIGIFCILEHEPFIEPKI